MGLRHLQRGSPVHCSQDHVALVQKILVGKTKKIWFIFDDKNGLFAMNWLGSCCSSKSIALSRF